MTTSGNLYNARPFPALLTFFVNWKRNFRISEPASNNKWTKPGLVNMPRAVIEVIIARVETKITKEKTKRTVPVLKVFTLIQIVSLRTVIKHKHNWTRIVCTVSCLQTVMMTNTTKLAWLLKICTNHGVIATVVMLYSIAASSSWRCMVIAVK